MATGHPFGKILLLGGILIGFVCLPSAEAALTRQNFNLPDLSRHMTGSPDDLRELLDTELQKNRELQFMKRAFPKEYRAFLDGLLNAGSRKKAERFIRTYLTRFFDDNLEMIMHAEQPFLLTLFADELAFRKRAAAESPRLCVRAIRDGEFPASEKIRHRLIPVASDEFLHLLQAMENGRKKPVTYDPVSYDQIGQAALDHADAEQSAFFARFFEKPAGQHSDKDLCKFLVTFADALDDADADTKAGFIIHEIEETLNSRKTKKRK